MINLALAFLATWILPSANAIVADLGPCIGALTAPTDIAGYFTNKPGIGDIVLFKKTAYVVERSFMGGGGQGHGHHDVYPDVPMYEVRKLDRELRYDDSLPTRKLSTATNWFNGDAEQFYVLGKIELGIANNQVYRQDQRPKLVELSRQMYVLRGKKSPNVGSVVIFPGKNGLYVVVGVEYGELSVAQLDPRDRFFVEKAEVKVMEQPPLAIVGFISKLEEGRKASMFASWNKFLSVFGEE